MSEKDFGDRRFQYVDVSDIALTSMLRELFDSAEIDTYEKYIDSIERLPGGVFRIYVG